MTTEEIQSLAIIVGSFLLLTIPVLLTLEIRQNKKKRRTLREKSVAVATNTPPSRIISEKDAQNLKPVTSLPVEYHYERKDLIMTSAETRFFKLLTETIGEEYYVFPQVHLSSILEHRIHGQNWWAAFHHINRKSVDFVVCDKQSIRPLLAVELDDWSHNLNHRKDRDKEVERIFDGAGLPLIRFGGGRNMSHAHVREIIEETNSLQLPTLINTL